VGISSLINRPAKLIRRTVSEDEFDPAVTTTETDVDCELQQRKRKEQDEAGEVSDTEWLLLLPTGTAVDTGDAIVVEGQKFEVVGDPWEARNPRTKRASHIEATVRRTEGTAGS
jgi:hypothetical protein